MRYSLFSNLLILAVPAYGQVISDPGAAGPALEVAHSFYDEWPTGIAVSSTGRLFANYPSGLDMNNTNNGSNGKYAVAELTSNTTETPYPSAEMNNPPGGAINYTTYPPSGANYQNYFIGVQSVVVDPADRLWVSDTGRASTDNGTLVTASYGGPKSVGINLSNNTVFQTIVFPTTVAYGDSYLNDVRFDLRSNITASGKGVAYITDSSTEGRNGIIIVDLGTGASWRHSNGDAVVRPQQQFLAYVWGQPLYSYMPGLPSTYLAFGSDGIASSADGNDLYFGAVSSRYLYSVPTEILRDQSATSEILAQAMVVNRGQKGVSDGFETDTNGFIYHGNMEQNAVSFYNPANGTDQLFVRDPRINWVDTFSTGTDGHLYFTVNQLCFSPSVTNLLNPGTDRRVRPFALMRVPLPNNGTKVSSK